MFIYRNLVKAIIKIMKSQIKMKIEKILQTRENIRQNLKNKYLI